MADSLSSIRRIRKISHKSWVWGIGGCGAASWARTGLADAGVARDRYLGIAARADRGARLGAARQIALPCTDDVLARWQRGLEGAVGAALRDDDRMHGIARMVDSDKR